MPKYIPVLLSLFLTACAQTYDPTKPLKENTGLVVAKFTMSGASSAQFLTKNTNKNLDNYSFVVKNDEKLFVFPMTAGTHSIDKVMYMQGMDFVDPDLNCLGTFVIKPGAANYIGDIYFDVDGPNEYIFFSTHNSSILVKDEFSNTQKEFAKQYPQPAQELPQEKSIIGPAACN
ncbi:hypothetical protein [Pseudoalteromonas 'SMAR']|uniref:hypothetical protein n=1 Tax=Pseudoalteromonas 'SMAR' TaxID=3416908 RepID=UPI003AF1FF89